MSGTHTLYLTATALAGGDFRVELRASSAAVIARAAIASEHDVRLSPIMVAFPQRGKKPEPPPKRITSIAFFFSPCPDRSLATLKSLLKPAEAERTHFSEGLASLVLLNCSSKRALQLRKAMGGCPLEFWKLRGGRVRLADVTMTPWQSPGPLTSPPPTLPLTEAPDLKVYVEQISASLSSLWAAYRIYFQQELPTLGRIARFAQLLLEEYVTVKVDPSDPAALALQKRANAIVASLVELSAALSYAVTQGTSGSMPILANRSPFPHHSLLGVGGSVRALTKFTRYLEAAFITRSAARVIKQQYSTLTQSIPISIPSYQSGPAYKIEPPVSNGADRSAVDLGPQPREYFDTGGAFQQDDDVPLISYFSLRHGYMEAKFCVTAASEALTVESQPQWTLMTLSHEIMHSRVRTIFQALFGTQRTESNPLLLHQEHYLCFKEWVESRTADGHAAKLIDGLRNATLNFCYAMALFFEPTRPSPRSDLGEVTYERLAESFGLYKRLAGEILVHFHDFYFAYAGNRKPYMMSLWASWIKVAAPFSRTLEYLVRSLATVACGTGLNAGAAFDASVEVLLESLDALEANGVKSALYPELRRLTQAPANRPRELFKPMYYLMDQVKLCFASPLIASHIDRLQEDPFAHGTTTTSEYASWVFIQGEGRSSSPIRFALSALYTALRGQPPITDRQWITAWNYMVILGGAPPEIVTNTVVLTNLVTSLSTNVVTLVTPAVYYTNLSLSPIVETAARVGGDLAPVPWGGAAGSVALGLAGTILAVINERRRRTALGEKATWEQTAGVLVDNVETVRKAALQLPGYTPAVDLQVVRSLEAAQRLAGVKDIVHQLVEQRTEDTITSSVPRA